MADQVTNDFDFEDWAGLYLENPQEFEARRQAALMIEMAKGTPEQAAAGKALLDAYEKRVKNCSPTERLQVASQMMADSAQQLNTELMMLKQGLENAVFGDETEAKAEADSILRKIMTEKTE